MTSWLEDLKSNVERFNKKYSNTKLTLENIKDLIKIENNVEHLDLHGKNNEELEQLSTGFCMKCDYGGSCTCSIAQSILGLREYKEYDNHRDIKVPNEKVFEYGLVNKNLYQN